jgi:hypothetical protein
MRKVFNILHTPKIFTKDNPKFNPELIMDVTPICHIGSFDKLYYFHEYWKIEQEQILCEWLSLNCTLNFIFVKYQSGIIAGGNVDNAAFWIAKKRRSRLYVTDYFLKLYEADVTMFELVWLTNFLGNV